MTNSTEARKGYLLIFLAGVLWGSIGFFVKTLEALGLTSVFISFCRMAPAFLIVAVITAARYGIRAFIVDKTTLLICAMLGLFGQAAFNILYSSAVTSIGMAFAAVLLYTSPIFTAVLSAVFFSEKITRIKCLALLINIVGCVLTVTGGNFSGTQLPVVGIFLGIGAGFGYALNTVIGKVASARANPFVVIAYSFFFASVFLAIFTDPFEGVADFISLKVVFVALGYALIPTCISYLLYYFGMQRITETSKVPVIASIEPVVAAGIGALVFHEQLAAANLLGIILVLISVALMSGILKRDLFKRSI